MNNPDYQYIHLDEGSSSYDNASSEAESAAYTNSLLNSILLKLEYLYTYFSLLFFTDALSFRSYFLVGEGDDYTGFETPIDPLIGLTRYAIFAFTILIIALRFKLIAPLLWRMRLLLLLSLLPYLSHFWSDFPEYSSKFGLFVFGTTLVGIYFAGRYTVREQLNFLGWVFGTIIGLCLLFIFLLPGSGIDTGMHAGAWRGVFWHKNNLGIYMTLSAIFFCLTAQADRIPWRKNLYWLLCAVSVVMMVMSTSKSALIVFAATFVLLLCCYVLRWNDLISIPIFLSLFVIGSGVTLWLIQSVDKILVLLGKGTTLSGRTDIWNSVYHYIQQRPLLGHGYAGFWVDIGQARFVWRDIGFEAVNSHNGFLDLLLDLGFVSLVLFLAIYIMAYARLLLLIRRSRNIKMFWPLLFLSLFLMYNFAEAQILKSSFNWVIFVTINCSIAQYWRSLQIEKSEKQPIPNY